MLADHLMELIVGNAAIALEAPCLDDLAYVGAVLVKCADFLYGGLNFLWPFKCLLTKVLADSDFWLF